MKKLFLFLLVATLALPAYAQQPAEPFTVNLQSMFYGDNTEFLSNPYREGETLLGVHNKLSLKIPLGEKAHLKLGVFTDSRAGGAKSFERVRPIMSLAIGNENNQFIMGTLETPASSETGPDRMGLHGLLPPIQVETFAFTRANEMGMQWIHKGRITSDVYIDWQQLNTPTQREKLNAGFVSKLAVAGPLSVGGQFQIVHHGGQLYASGSVSDSSAGAVGVVFDRQNNFLKDRLTGDFYYVGGKNDPDRQFAATNLSGHGVFMRAAYEVACVRPYFIAWRAKDFVKQEGDPNYSQQLLTGGYDSAVGTGTPHRYYETGVSTRFNPASKVWIEPAFRLHWTNGHLDYSYRIVAALAFDYALGRRK